MIRLALGSLILLALLVAAGSGAAQAQELQWLTKRDGLPSGQVHQIVQGKDDHLWMATPAGLARFDGARIRTLSRLDGLTTQGLRSLAVAADGTLWVGSDAGIDLVDDGGSRALDSAWRWGFVEAMTFDDDGALWIASSAGLLHWTAESGVAEVEEPALVGTLIIDVESAGDGGPLWIITANGLYRRDGDGAVSAVVAPALAELAPLRSISAHPQGLWVGGDGGLALLSKNGDAEIIARSDSGSGVTAILEVNDELWLGISGQLQLYRRDGERWRFDAVVLPSTLINDIFEDSLGDVWFATDSAGAAKASGLRRWLGVAPLACDTQIYAIAATDDGYLIGGESCSWTTGPDLEVRSTLQGLSRVKVWDLLLARDGALWAATEIGLRIGRVDGAFASRDFGLSVLQAPGRVLLEDASGVWVGTVTGLARIENGVGREVLDPEGERFGYVYTLEHEALTTGQDGHPAAVWIGTIGRGAFRWTAERGIERPIASLGQGNVYAIATRDDGTVAFLHDDRVEIWQDGRLRSLEPATRDAVAGWSAEFAPGDVLWVGSLDGLVRYDLKGGPSRRAVASMGLAGNEFTTSRSLYRAADGMLVQGTDGGLSWMRPDGIEAAVPKPRPQLIDIHWSGVAAAKVGGALEVRQGRWSMDADVASPWFIDATSLAYRYWLHGFDDHWSEPRGLREPGIRYTALPPGTYRLEAQIYSPLVGWGAAEQLVTLRVVPTWWNTVWARLAALLGLALAVTGFWRWRNRALLRRSQWLEQKVRHRTADLERLALSDPLTGLPNRRSFRVSGERFLAGANRRQEGFALVLIDLDGFKELNDRLGHQAGDQALIAVAGILSELARDEDVLSRYGGDELVLLCHRGNDAEARIAAERLRKALAEATLFEYEGEAVRLTASFGVASWAEGVDLQTLFQRADLATYEAKRTKNAVVVWTPDLEEPGDRNGTWSRKELAPEESEQA